VTVTAPAITLSSLPATVGAGLQDGAYGGSLGGANHGGVTVHIASSNAAVVRLSRNATTPGAAFIDIPVTNGQTAFSYYIHGMEGTSGGVTLTASVPGFTDNTGTVAVVAPAIELIGVPATTTTLSASTNFYARVGLPNSNNTGLNALQAIRAGASTVVVTIANETAAVAQLTTLAGTAQTRTVSIQAGQYNSPTQLSDDGIEFDPIGEGTTRVIATAPGFTSLATATRSVTVTASGITLGSLPTTVGAGLQDGAYGGSLGGSSHPGLTVRIASGDPTRLLLSANSTTAGTAFIDIPVNAGQTAFSYYIQGVEGTTGDVTVTASAPGFTNGSGIVHVVQPALQIENLGSTQSATGTSDVFYVRVGIPNGVGTALLQSQNVRAGGALTVTVTNSNAAVAQLVTQAGGAQSRTVVIAAGVNTSPTTVAGGGIAFDPLQVGDTTVRASIPGFITTSAGIVAIEVR
jgi:antitoxin (DNA-binding transcriptional repressor) of toxin-antitoxin stability system